jgi:DnaJ-class molecular chaperone
MRGSHYVKVKVEIPKSISGEEQKLIEQLQKLR